MINRITICMIGASVVKVPRGRTNAIAIIRGRGQRDRQLYGCVVACGCRGIRIVYGYNDWGCARWQGIGTDGGSAKQTGVGVAVGAIAGKIESIVAYSRERRWNVGVCCLGGW